MTAPDYPDLKGKLVLITGGASGIGAAVVRAFAAQGSRIVFYDINQADGDALCAELAGGVHFERVDLTDSDAILTSIETIRISHGDVDVLVNGAANDTRHGLDDVTPESWRSILSVNLDHQFFCAQSVPPGMRKNGGGAILNFGSIAWRVGLKDAVGYVTAKAAIEGLTHALAREEGPHGIRVNCLLPGFVRTERQVEKWLTPELHATVMDRQCIGRFNEPEDIANVAVFLCSEAARSISNQTIVADAGWS